MRPHRALLLPALTAWLVALPAPARADERLNFLASQIERGKDPRVRMQASLVLSQTDDPRAVGPLCKGLSDESALVRRACAKGLGELAYLEAIDCLAKAKGEKDPAVKAEVERVLRELEALRSQKPKVYVAYTVVEKAPGVGAEMVRFADAVLRKKLVHRGVLVAPPNESKAAAAAVVKQKRIRAFALNVALQSADGGAVRMTALCLTYPDRKILGELTAKAAGAEPAELIRALVPKLVQDASQTFDWSL